MLLKKAKKIITENENLMFQMEAFKLMNKSKFLYLPTICIMKEAKTTTQPQPPSGGVMLGVSSSSTAASTKVCASAADGGVDSADFGLLPFWSSA